MRHRSESRVPAFMDHPPHYGTAVAPPPAPRCYSYAVGRSLRRLLLLGGLGAMLGCSDPAESISPPLEYRWGPTEPFLPLASIKREPPGRPAADAELEIRATVPFIAADDPTLDV